MFVRISATDWAEGPERDEKTGRWRYWGIQQSKVLAGELKVRSKIRVMERKGGGRGDGNACES